MQPCVREREAALRQIPQIWRFLATYPCPSTPEREKPFSAGRATQLEPPARPVSRMSAPPRGGSIAMPDSSLLVSAAADC